MPAFILYMLKMSIALTVFFVFYYCFLRKLTFYNLNRIYLLGYSFLALLIPFINISLFVNHDSGSASQIVNMIPQFYYGDDLTETSGTSVASWNSWNWIQFIVTIGMVCLFVQLIIRLLSFFILRKKSRKLHSKGLSIYQVNEEIIPFSFGRSIFINSTLHSETELEEIIRHEFVHVRQGHTLDIIWSELLCIFNWYNPAAWLFRKAIRQNLEFIADNKVLQQGIDRKQYQYLLLKVIGNKHFSIANKFNFSSLKKRIAMMNKMKTAKVHMLRFLFIIPLLAIVLLAFRTNKYQLLPSVSTNEIVDGNSIVHDTIPLIIDARQQVNTKGFLIDVVDKNGSSTVEVKDKAGKVIELVDLNKWQGDNKYTEKYGDIPPVKTTLTEVRVDRSGADLEIIDSKARVTLRNGKTEEYDLDNAAQRKTFEEKYGKVIELPVDGSGSNVYQVDQSGAIIGVGVAHGKGSGSGVGNGSGSGNGSGNGNSETIADIAEVAVIATPASTVNGMSIINTANAPVTVIGYPKKADESIAPASVVGVNAPNKAVSTPRNMNVINATDGEIIATDGRSIFDSEDAIVITISKKNTRADLEKHKQDLKSQGIELTFENIEYNDAGELVSLSGKLKFNDSTGSFVAKDFSKVRIHIVKDDGKIHFRISTNEKIVS